MLVTEPARTARPTVSLRRARAEDAEQVRRWRNTSFIVSRTSTGTPVNNRDHEAWFTASLASPDRIMWIVCVDDADTGVVRFDRTDADTAVISVYLDEGATGGGAGITAIRDGCARVQEAWPVTRITAFVRNDNPLGHKAFPKAGFARSAGLAAPSDHVAYELGAD